MSPAKEKPPTVVAHNSSHGAEADESERPQQHRTAYAAAHDYGAAATDAAQAEMGRIRACNAWLVLMELARETAQEAEAEQHARWRLQDGEPVGEGEGMTVPGQFLFGMVLGVALAWLVLIVPTAPVVAGAVRP